MRARVRFPGRSGEALAELARGFEAATFVEDPGATAGIATTIFGGPQCGGGLTLHLRGTPFQIKVWRALLAIPPGRVTSYGDVARRIGAPRASRATGTAIASNPIAWIIPCHRVIRASGVLGEYRWGRARKLSDAQPGGRRDRAVTVAERLDRRRMAHFGPGGGADTARQILEAPSSLS